MTVLTPGQVKGLIVAAGATEAEANILTAIAAAESGNDTEAVGDTTIQTAKWGPSIGLWQIRSLKDVSSYTGVDGMRDRVKLLDGAYNAKVAYALYKQKTGYGDWSVFKSGAYKKYLKYSDTPTVTVTSGDLTGTTAGRAPENITEAATSAIGLENVNAIAGTLNTGSFWKRVGWGAAGYAMLAAGLLVILLSNKDVRSAIGTTTDTAVSLVPGGGVVTKVTKGITVKGKTVASAAAKTNGAVK